MSLAIIGGTGLYDLGRPAEAEIIATPYGEAAVFRAELDGQSVIFLARHGAGHSVPPHRINYRANIWALRALGVREVVATQAVGSLNPHMAPGHFVLLSQFIDWTRSRPFTFFDGDDGRVMHVDVTNPYCPRVIGALLQAGAPLGNALHPDGVYACTEGPRFETAAEVKALRTLGADVVGMTNVPEVVLAREAGLCYAAICIVCNWGAGMTKIPLTQEEVLGIMDERAADLRTLLTRFAATPHDGPCPCEGLGFGQYLPGIT
ncbi:MAG: S-methyl-5'-thioadenosine phosphorylase [Armatimonadota bacterium]